MEEKKEIGMKRCEICNEEGCEYSIDDGVDTLDMHIYCDKHASENGYCTSCGGFYGGVTEEEMSLARTQMCTACDELWKEEFEYSPDDSEEGGWDEQD